MGTGKNVVRHFGRSASGQPFRCQHPRGPSLGRLPSFRMTAVEDWLAKQKAAGSAAFDLPMGSYFLGATGAGLAGVMGLELEAGLAAGAAGGGTPDSRLYASTTSLVMLTWGTAHSSWPWGSLSL